MYYHTSTEPNNLHETYRSMVTGALGMMVYAILSQLSLQPLASQVGIRNAISNSSCEYAEYAR
jgi:hypothetical protein